MSKAKPAVIAALLVAITLVAWGRHSESRGYFSIETHPAQVVADGRSPLVLHVTPKGRTLQSRTLKVSLVEGEKFASIESVKVDADSVEIRIRPEILAGRVVLEVDARDFAASRTEFTTSILASDGWHDGTPDFLRLGPDDDGAFRNWFTYLAESQYYRPAARLSKEINDCAALIRFAYHEAFREHDARWANDLDLDEAVPLPSVQKFRYPYTPAGPALFRIRDGEFRVTDLTDGTFAQFADARSLQRFNTHFVSKDVRAARPGDLFFYRQLDQDMPFHTMIFLGPSHFDADTSPRVVYHTGPMGDAAGEIRRPTLDALLHHPEPRWRPVAANSSFLGVYRWNILR